MEISINQATELQNQLKNVDQFYLAKSYLIPSDLLSQALNLSPEQLSQFAGLRIYLGAEYSAPVDQAANNNGTLTVSPVIVAVDNNGNDIMIQTPTESNSKIFTSSFFCPPTCPANNNLSENAIIKIS